MKMNHRGFANEREAIRDYCLTKQGHPFITSECFLIFKIFSTGGVLTFLKILKYVSRRISNVINDNFMPRICQHSHKCIEHSYKAITIDGKNYSPCFTTGEKETQRYQVIVQVYTGCDIGRAKWRVEMIRSQVKPIKTSD